MKNAIRPTFDLLYDLGFRPVKCQSNDILNDWFYSVQFGTVQKNNPICQVILTTSNEFKLQLWRSSLLIDLSFASINDLKLFVGLFGILTSNQTKQQAAQIEALILSFSR